MKVSQLNTPFASDARGSIVADAYRPYAGIRAGRGVDRSLREAYRWFTVAANAGDGASRAKAILLENQLSARERVERDQVAAKFQPGAENAADLTWALPPATSLAETQTYLARQRYYVGPSDGRGSASFREAVDAYIQDHPAASPVPR